MDLSLIEKGNTYASFAALCRVSGVEPKNGAMKQTQENEMRRYLNWEKVGKGHKIIITEVYDEPKEKKYSKTFPFVNGSYYTILLELLKGSKVSAENLQTDINFCRHTISLNRLKLLSELCNENFISTARYPTEVSEYFEMDKENVKDLFKNGQSTIDTHLTYILEELRKKRIITGYATAKLGQFATLVSNIEDVDDLDTYTQDIEKEFRPIYVDDEINAKIARIEKEELDAHGFENKFAANASSSGREINTRIRNRFVQELGLIFYANAVTFYFDYDYLFSIVESFEFETSNGEIHTANDFMKERMKELSAKRSERELEKLKNGEKLINFRRINKKYGEDTEVFVENMIDREAEIVKNKIKENFGTNKQT